MERPAEDEPPAQLAGADDVGHVALLRADRALLDAVPPDHRALAERAGTVPCVRAGPGQWSPAQLAAASDEPFMAVLVEGVLTREVALGARPTAQLLGSGDVFDPWTELTAALPVGVSWQVHERAVIAALDNRALRLLREWPTLGVALQRRHAAQADRVAVQCAILSLPKVDDRIVALFWHLAEQWGRVGSDGIVIPMRLTHEAVGRLIGAQRSTVSLALGALSEEGTLRRESDNWLLRHGTERTLSRFLAADD